MFHRTACVILLDNLFGLSWIGDKIIKWLKAGISNTRPAKNDYAARADNSIEKLRFQQFFVVDVVRRAINLSQSATRGTCFSANVPLSGFEFETPV